MCPPLHFAVVYSINPWMHPELPADARLAVRQWEVLRTAYEQAGHSVETISPKRGLPDMVFAANSALVLDGTAFLARFHYRQRQAEAPAYERWFRAHGLTVRRAEHDHEGEGDFACAGDVILAGTGFRTDPAAHREVQELFGREVVTLELVDPRFYHLDTALFVLDGDEIAYFPDAFSADSRQVLRRRYPDAMRRRSARRACVRLQRHERRPQRVHAARNRPPRRGARSARVRTRARRAVGAAQGRGQREVLHARAARRRAMTRHTAPNYAPLPVTIVEGEGAWVTDASGRRYLDCLSAYSALNFGHRHPRLVAAAARATRPAHAVQPRVRKRPARPVLRRARRPLRHGSRAPHEHRSRGRRVGDQGRAPVGLSREGCAARPCRDHRLHRQLPRAYDDDRRVLVGPDARDGFGPFTPGFVSVPFGDAGALRAAINDHTVAFLFEPVQGEAGVIVPPPGYLAAVRRVCTDAGILMIADEIQSGLARTGRTFACDHEHVRPDVYVLGKALGGGIMPLSAVVADHDVLGLLTAGTHGSTFGGNPLACAVGREVIAMLRTGEYQERATRLGHQLARSLGALVGHGAGAVRVHGLWAGVDVGDPSVPARKVCEILLERGVLAKDAHEHTLRLAPPIVSTARDLAFATDQVADALATATRTAATAMA